MSLSRGRRRSHWFTGVACALAFAGSGCGPRAATGTEDDIVVGLLLPFTGGSSATGANFERSVLFATEQVNRAGGVDGRRLRLVSKDTHSEAERTARSVEALIDAGAVAVLGPESAELAEQVEPLLTDSDVVFLSPYVGDAGASDGNCEPPWFRLAPSARTLGEALARDILDQGAARVAVVSSAERYDDALASAAATRLESRGAEVVLRASVDPAAQSYASVVKQLNELRPDAIVLSTSPRSAALLVNEQHTSTGRSPNWYLSPLLKTDIFILNVVPEAIEGARGTAPRIYEQSDAFPAAFGERWHGDRPLEGAYFYFDAVGLLSLALQHAAVDLEQDITSRSLSAALVDVAAPPGEAYGWNELPDALSQQRRGETVYYSGLTGPMLLDACGARRLGVSSRWTVRDGAIETIEEE